MPASLLVALLSPREQQNLTALQYDLVLNVMTSNKHISAELGYWTSGLSDWQAENIAHTLSEMISVIAHSPGQLIKDLTVISPRDKDQIGKWNSVLPVTPTSCVHTIIGDRAKQQPERPAVCAWDGNLTYKEMDELSSLLAQQLRENGVGPGAFVPLCFEKSLWAIVSMLAVMKVGAAFVPMDPSQPRRRLEAIIQDVNASMIIVSPQYDNLVAAPNKKIFPVGGALHLEQRHDLKEWESNDVSYESVAFVLYTSGSTGKPKGCVIEHAGFCAAMYAQRTALGLGKDSRVLQMASFSFDACLLEILTTLGAGGCVCVPSDTQRMGDNIGQAIRDLDVNWAHLTPSVAQRINSKGLTGLKTLLFAGEPVTDSTLEQWTMPSRQLHIAYGASECSIMSTLNADVGPGRGSPNIGFPTGCMCWIVDPANHTRLLPVGAIGELVIQGPIVGRGYIRDEAGDAFLEDLQFLSEGSRSRSYKTGDLVSYSADGSINFMGRKDNQVKLRGQRIELGEVEHYIRQFLPESASAAVADIVIPLDRPGKPMLVAFLGQASRSGAYTYEPSDLELSPVDDRMRETLTKMIEELAEVLAIYMVPSAFIPLKRIPLTPTGKTDRGKLRRWASNLSNESLVAFLAGPMAAKRQPTGDIELKLQKLWCKVLGLDTQRIGIEDSFIGLGGDSIDAMMLVGLARAEGVDLSITNVFRHPTLQDLARQATLGISPLAPAAVAAFSILDENSSLEDIVCEAAISCGVSNELIEDIYPCTPVQEGIMILSTTHPGAYIAQHVLNLPGEVEISRFKAAWEAVVVSTATLRTRLFQSMSAGTLQAVTKERIAWRFTTTLSSYLEQDRNIPMSFGTPLTRFALIEEAGSARRYFILTAHHAVFDGWSLGLVYRSVSQNYDGAISESRPKYNGFIKYLSGIEDDASVTYVSDFPNTILGISLSWETYFESIKVTISRKSSFAAAAKPLWRTIVSSLHYNLFHFYYVC